MSKNISFDDVLASKAKFGCVLQLDLKKVRDLKKLNPKAKFDATYIPIVFKHINGKLVKCSINFFEQLIASGAKAPQGSDEEGIAKYLNISIMKMLKEDIEGGDFVAKPKEGDEKQEKENKRISDNILRYMKNNVIFVEVLEIIDSSYKILCDELKSKEKDLDFKIKKDRKQTDTVVYSMKQHTRLNKETQEDEALENPIYRLKLTTCKQEGVHKGKIGIWSHYNKEFKPTVFDARKMNKKNNYQPVVATVKINGKSRSLDAANANSFITYKSIIGGTIVFDCIVSSKFGLSLSNSFYDIFVFRHKTKAVQQVVSKADIIAMRGGGDEDESDNESDVEVEAVETNNSDDDEEEYDDDEKEEEAPHDSDDDEEEDVPKKKGKK
jgi:hypothetical protein